MIPTTLTHRQALAQARRTYETLYRAVLAETVEDERARVERTYARGLAALDGQTATDASLSTTAAEAFNAYMRSAADGDAEAKFAWLKMMPRVVSEIAGGIEPVWVFGPRYSARYEVFLNTTLHAFDTLVHVANETWVPYETITHIEPVQDWQFTVRPERAWYSLFVSWSLPRRHERPDRERQSTLALAA
jgi:hypothetical protein